MKSLDKHKTGLIDELVRGLKQEMLWVNL